MVRMVNSGTEAVMSALRLARAYTGRQKIIKFEGCYHGHTDSMLVKAGSGALTAGVPDSLGITASVAADTLTAPYNDLEKVEKLLKQHETACIIVEPVAANMGVVLPKENFLQGLRELCDIYGALLIFDEVITGFRLGKGGAQAFYGVRADIVTYGKIIGGGMPVGAYGGRKEIMELIAPCGAVYQAGTLSGNLIAMAAGLAQLEMLEKQDVYGHINKMGARLAAGLGGITQHMRCACVNHVGSLCCLFLGIGEAYDYQSVKKADTAGYAEYFREMLALGVYLAPSQFEAMFVSFAHTAGDCININPQSRCFMKGILVIAHGSRAKETEATLEAVLSMVKIKMPETPMECAFMEFSDRTVEKGVSALVAQAVTEIRVVPYFLFMGIHMKEDIPNMVAECAAHHPGVKITMAEPFGVDERLADMLIDRIKG
jgi:glutamate-1-semialdehyde 2,1-aminomutase